MASPRFGRDESYTPPDSLRRFDARFASECGCGVLIEEGDEIARTPEGEFICGDCIEAWED